MAARKKPEPPVAKLVLYAGRVQGVGFRATTQSLAGGHPVTGWVRNLEDGRVEMWAQGAPAAVEAFLRDIDRTMHRHIEGAAVDDRPADPDMKGFRVRY